MIRKKILVLGPNPAWQKTLFFKTFEYGKVNRAERMELCASGKGINFCRAATLHGKCAPMLLQFTGGDNGCYINRALRDETFESCSIDTIAPTRCCTTCLDCSNQQMTEVIEPSFAATGQEVRRFLDTFALELHGAAAVALCGTLPTGTDPELYVHAARLAAEAGVPILADSYRGIDHVLRTGGAVTLKINAEELSCLTGCSNVADGFRKLFHETTLQYAAITDGPHTAYATDGKTMTAYTLPELPNIVNPIGCGDTASAVLTAELLCGTAFFKAFQIALACASANCQTALPGSFSPETAAQLAEQITTQIQML